MRLSAPAPPSCRSVFPSRRFDLNHGLAEFRRGGTLVPFRRNELGFWHRFGDGVRACSNQLKPAFAQRALQFHRVRSTRSWPRLGLNRRGLHRDVLIPYPDLCANRMLLGGYLPQRARYGFCGGNGRNGGSVCRLALHRSALLVALRRDCVWAALTAIPLSAAAPPAAFIIPPALIGGTRLRCRRASRRHGLTLAALLGPLAPPLALFAGRGLPAIRPLEARPFAASETLFRTAFSARTKTFPVSSATALGPVLLGLTTRLNRCGCLGLRGNRALSPEPAEDSAN